MRFIESSLFFYWAPLVLVPILLYLFRPRPRTVRTSTLPFFKWLAREHQDSAWLRRLKYLLSLLICILVVLAIASALGRLVVSPAANSLQTVVVLVDRSASMASVDEEDVTRLESAIQKIKDRLVGLSAGVGIVVVAYDRRPEVILSRSMDRRQVERALDKIRVRPIDGDPAAALGLSRQLANLETPASIWHATDGLEAAMAEINETMNATNVGDEDAPGEDAPGEDAPDDGSSTDESSTDESSGDESSGDDPLLPEGGRDLSAPVPIQHIGVTLVQPVNVGITAVQLRRLPLEGARFEVFVQIHASGPQAVSANLDIEIDGKLVAPRRLTIEPGAREKLMIPVDAQQDVDKVLALKLSAEGDVFSLDDIAHVRIPRLRPVQVLWISESSDPFTELALSTLGVDDDLQLLKGSPSAWPPKEPVSVVIFDGWLPDKWPADIAVIVVNPPRSVGPIQAARIGKAGLPLSSLRSPGSRHPVLYGVATQRIAVTQTAIIKATGPLESLWVGSQGPVLLAGELGRQRIVVMGFSPQNSEQLPLMASYPLLLGNAIYWSAESDIETALGMNYRTGELVELEGRTLTWQQPDGESMSEESVRLEGQSHELDRVGLWTTEASESGSASLLSTNESRIAGLEPTESTEGQDAASSAFFKGNMVPFLLWGVFIILVLENWMFHRHITY